MIILKKFSVQMETLVLGFRKVSSRLSKVRRIVVSKVLISMIIKTVE